ncbi:MAG: hypothetical protein U0570_08405 [Phycisphaerales bacterium]
MPAAHADSTNLPPIPPADPIDPDTSLAAAPEPYLHSLHRGLTLMLVAFVASLAIAFPFYIILVFLLVTNAATGIAPLSIGFAILMLLVGAIGWGGQYLLTIPDPRGVWNQTFENYRRLLRLFLWLGVLMAIIGLWSAFSAFNSNSISRPTSFSRPSSFSLEFILRTGFQLTAFLISFAYMVIMMLFLEQIGLRLHDPWIAARAKLLVWLVPVLLILSCTIIAPLAAAALQAHLYLKIRSRLGELMAKNYTY